MKYLKVFEEYSNDELPKYFYHTTPLRNWESILKNGLEPNYTESSLKKRGVYLTDYSNALVYKETISEPCIILEVDTKFLKIDMLYPDDGEYLGYLSNLNNKHPLYNKKWHDTSWEESYNICKQIQYLENIPTVAIRKV